jgi:hypothetical protein
MEHMTPKEAIEDRARRRQQSLTHYGEPVVVPISDPVALEAAEVAPLVVRFGAVGVPAGDATIDFGDGHPVVGFEDGVTRTYAASGLYVAVLLVNGDPVASANVVTTEPPLPAPDVPPIEPAEATE